MTFLGFAEVLGSIRDTVIMHQGISIKMTQYYQTGCEVLVVLIEYPRYHFVNHIFPSVLAEGNTFFFGKGIKISAIIQVPKKEGKGQTKR